MKCTPIKLLSRAEYVRKTEMKKQNVDQIFITKECNGYTVSFTKGLFQKPSRPSSLSVKTISLPDGLQAYNGGYSLEKWSKKRPRLRSGKLEQKYLEYDYDNTCDVMDFIDSWDDTEDNSELLLADPSHIDDDYEISSDVEELIRNSRSSESNTYSIEPELRKGETRKKQKKSRKMIRFSFSKPVSPETEQIIRVDVTSNISVDDLRKADLFNSSKKNDSRMECGRASDKDLSTP
ncbi:unnamed protein product [Acanthoscelides obtectus]|uniref:Uncharacterized protein n=1 Tax=Acanthoscelides obtectus TaxID=200917 RepID=A0A9P0JYK6_ACAOB|nr:unnamed protein product [Acanthoscelides obtectus]CAK1633808.1 hypothetical protein AOBTE_LOCUS8404 [Acanthoscelides obtectus]